MRHRAPNPRAAASPWKSITGYPVLLSRPVPDLTRREAHGFEQIGHHRSKHPFRPRGYTASINIRQVDAPDRAEVARGLANTPRQAQESGSSAKPHTMSTTEAGALAPVNCPDGGKACHTSECVPVQRVKPKWFAAVSAFLQRCAECQKCIEQCTERWPDAWRHLPEYGHREGLLHTAIMSAIRH